MSTETWGATVEDVRDLLRHVSAEETAQSSNPHYRQNTTRHIGDAEIQRYLEKAGARVSARVSRYEEVPERTRENIRLMAGALVADGAAHYAQAALFPASSSPNNGSSYATLLWQRFQTGLDQMAVLVDDEAEKVAVAASGTVSYDFPVAQFPDGVAW